MPDQKQQMTEEERKARNAEHQRKYRESQRNNPEYWERRHEYSRKFREKNAKKIAEKKRADYEKRKAEAPPKAPKEPKTKERPKKALPDLKEILPPEDAEWKAPATCEILCASKDYGDTRRYATIEQRKPAYRPLRLKVVVFGNSIAELKREAAKIGINSFWNYGHVK